MMNTMKKNDGIIPGMTTVALILLYLFSLGICKVWTNIGFLIAIMFFSFLSEICCNESKYIKIVSDIFILFLCLIGINIAIIDATNLQTYIFFTLIVLQSSKIASQFHLK